MRAAREQQGCASVPEVMPAYVWQLSTAEHRLEVAVNYVLRVEGGTDACGEHQSVIGPYSSGPKPYTLLDAYDGL